MKKKRLRIPFWIIGIIMFAVVCAFQYFYKLDVIQKKPNEKWSKSKVLSSGDLTAGIAVEKVEDNYITAFNDKDNLHVMTVDKLGNILSQVEIKEKSKFIKGLNLVESGDYIYFVYEVNESSTKKFKILKLDKELKISDVQEIENVNSSVKLNNTVFALAYEDRIEIVDIENNENLGVVKDRNPKELISVSIDKGIVFAYKNFHNNCMYVIYNEDFISEPKVICNLYNGLGTKYENMRITSRDNYLFLIIDNYLKGNLEKTVYFKYSLEEEKVVKREALGIDDQGNVRHIYAGNNSKFYGDIEKRYGMKTVRKSLIEFKLDDSEKVINVNEIQRFAEDYNFIYSIDDVIFYGEYKSLNNYDITMCSQNEEFKNAFNETTNNEKLYAKIAFSDSVLLSISYVSVMLLMLMLFYVILIAVYGVCNEKFRGYKIPMFLKACIAGAVIKMLLIRSVFYDRFVYYMPEELSSVYIGMLISLGLSIFIYSFSFMSFKRNEYNVEFGKFIGFMIFDGFLTLFLFFPLII